MSKLHDKQTVAGVILITWLII